jgi:hypothetical protein
LEEEGDVVDVGMSSPRFRLGEGSVIPYVVVVLSVVVRLEIAPFPVPLPFLAVGCTGGGRAECGEIKSSFIFEGWSFVFIFPPVVDVVVFLLAVGER